MTEPCVQFDGGPLTGGTRFERPRLIISAWSGGDVSAALAALEEAHRNGAWLAGYMSYELGYHLDAKLKPIAPDQDRVPLLSFGVFDRPQAATAFPDEGAALGAWRSGWSRDEYRQAFETVHAYICAGDIYQANLTFPLEAAMAGSPEAVYSFLAAQQAAPFGALVRLDGPPILSRSPELFFSCDGRQRLTARPMKGTIARGLTDAEDAANRLQLSTSEKDRAENLMIVDLLRNDLSRIAEIGTVKVPRMFEIEHYATVHQMTSTVEATLSAGTSLSQIFTALFPCGSVTGAPKIRAMEILRDLEIGRRDAYCGSIGWIAPSGEMAFNVAIRTLQCFEPDRATLHVGGGVVYDSTADAEYDEALLKSRFARGMEPINSPAPPL